MSSDIRHRRWQNFKANRRGYYALWLFLLLFGLSLFAELIANDKPLMIRHEDQLYFPVFSVYAETEFGGDFATEADYRDPYVIALIEDAGGWMVWPPLRYSYNTINLNLDQPAPSPPSRQNL